MVNEKRIKRLRRLMGLVAIYPKPDLSKGHGRTRIPVIHIGRIQVIGGKPW